MVTLSSRDTFLLLPVKVVLFQVMPAPQGLTEFVALHRCSRGHKHVLPHSPPGGAMGLIDVLVDVQTAVRPGLGPRGQPIIPFLQEMKVQSLKSVSQSVSQSINQSINQSLLFLFFAGKIIILYKIKTRTCLQMSHVCLWSRNTLVLLNHVILD